MKEIELPSGKYLLVEVNKYVSAKDCEIKGGFLYQNPLSTRVILYPGNWQIIGKASELSWQNWVSIIESENDGSGDLYSWWYKDYMTEFIMTKNSTKSGHSLIKSHSMKPETTLILKLQ